MEAVSTVNKSQKKSDRSMSSPAQKAKVYSKPISTTNSDVSKQKAKLRTSKDVYNRLKWDASSLNIDITQVYIGYKDRFMGMCEVVFTDFNPLANDGDIPYHRIYYFRGGGPPVSPLIGKDGEIAVREDNWPPGAIIYWDRESRLDLIFNSGETSRGNKAKPRRGPASKSLQTPSGYEVVPVYRYSSESGKWDIDDNVAKEIVVQEFKVLTLNVLYEFYEEDYCVPNQRWPYLIDFLEDSDADIIALQEVTSKFLILLESVQWVQQNYLLSDTSASAKTIGPYGQIFLTKLKFQPCQMFYSEQLSKRFVIAVFPLEHGNLAMANIHLISNFKGDSANLRQKQLQHVISSVSQIQPTMEMMIIGDTNFYNDEVSSSNKVYDIWCDDENPGWTYDIEKNPLAKYFSRGTTKARFDRIFLNTDSQLIEPLQMFVSGDSLIDFSVPPRSTAGQKSLLPPLDSPNHTLSLSDHHALCCNFAVRSPSTGIEAPDLDASSLAMTTVDLQDDHGLLNPKASAQSVYTSAVSIIPPRLTWDKIQKIRIDFDPAYDRWPPHINLLYGFLPDENANFTSAHAKFEKILQNHLPMKIRLEKLRSFEHSNQTTIYLTVEDTTVEAQMKSLQALLREAYPQCHSNKDFVPHLTIAKVSTPDAGELMEKFRKTLLEESSIEFDLNKIFIISRQLNRPFRVRKTVKFGDMEPKADDLYLEIFLKLNNMLPSPSRKLLEDEVLKESATLCAQLGQTSIHLVGSTAVGSHDDNSDIDLLVCGPREMSHAMFFDGLRILMIKSKTNLQLISIVLETLVPIARFKYQGIDIDMVFCPCGANGLEEVTTAELWNQSETFVRSIDGVLEGRELSRLIPSSWWPTYCKCIRALRFWAKRRFIYGQVMGFLTSNTLALLLAKVILTSGSDLHPEKTTAEELLVAFFYFYSTWKWPNPVAFLESSGPTLSPVYASKVPDVMPIRAPSYPYLNRARNVTKCTRSIIQKEIVRGNDIFAEIEVNGEDQWKKICEAADFWHEYPLYVQIYVKCQVQDVVLVKGVLSSRLVKFMVQFYDCFRLVCQPYTEILSPAEDVLVAVIGCEVAATDGPVVWASDLNDVTERFKGYLEGRLAKYVPGKVDITIQKDNASLPSLRALATPTTSTGDKLEASAEQ